MRWGPAIVVTAPLLVLWLLYGIGAQTETAELCLDAGTRERVRTLVLDAFDEAFKKHADGLFQNWVRDDLQQPERAIAGMTKSIRVYSMARTNALTWNPPTC